MNVAGMPPACALEMGEVGLVRGWRSCLAYPRLPSLIPPGSWEGIRVLVRWIGFARLVPRLSFFGGLGDWGALIDGTGASIVLMSGTFQPVRWMGLRRSIGVSGYSRFRE